MTRLSWGGTGTRLFEAGVDRGVLYPKNAPGVNWDGLTDISESQGASDSTPIVIDGWQVSPGQSLGSFSGTISALTYPDEFDLLLTSQRRRPFDLSYRTRVGNDVRGVAHGYKLHLVYNAKLAKSAADYSTMESEVNPTAFSWPFTTTPIHIEGRRGSAHLIIDSTVAWGHAVSAVEDILYGTDSSDPRIPTPQEVLDIFEDSVVLRITDHGDGTWTAEGPDEAIRYLDATTFEIDWPSVVYITDDMYQISSL